LPASYTADSSATAASPTAVTTIAAVIVYVVIAFHCIMPDT